MRVWGMKSSRSWMVFPDTIRSKSERKTSTFFEPFPPLESARRDHHDGHLVALFFATSFLPIFSIPIVSSVCALLWPLSVFNTFYIAGFIFSSSWWCLRSFLALTWYNFNIVSRHLAASMYTPHRPPSDCSTLFTWSIHSCHTANVPLFCHHSFTPQGGPPVFPPHPHSWSS